MMLYAVITLVAVSSAVFADDDGFCSTNTATLEVNKIMPNVIGQIKKAGSGNVVDTFKISFYPRMLFAFIFPFHVYLESSIGTVTNLKTLTQDTDTFSQCDKIAHIRDMEGRLKYGTLEVKSNQVKAGFWMFEFEGEITYKFSAVVPFKIHQDGSTCGLPSTTDLNYVPGEKSLELEAQFGWGIISKITSFFLRYGDYYGELDSVLTKSVVSPVNDYFIKYWCDNHHAP